MAKNVRHFEGERGPHMTAIKIVEKLALNRVCLYETRTEPSYNMCRIGTPRHICPLYMQLFLMYRV